MLFLHPEVRRELERWVRSGYPDETCGLLLGRMDESGSKALRAHLAGNLELERPRDRYVLDPADYLAADCAARASGLEIVGVWHSHPDRPAEPSATDRDAAWEGWSYLIASVGETGAASWRSWRLAGRRFEEETVADCAAAAPANLRPS